MLKYKMNTAIVLIIFICILFMSIAYSALNTTLTISGEATANIGKSIKITNVILKETFNDASELYNSNFIKNTVNLGLNLPNENSYVIYTISVTNGTSFDYYLGDINIINNNDSIGVEIVDKNSIFLIKNNVTDFDIKVSYKNELSVIKDVAISIEFEFVQNYIEDILKGAHPILINELLPVTISDDGKAMVANLQDKWYSYTEKTWANAVIIKEEARSEYTVSGKEIDSNDIIAYYVWIPRFEYKIFDDDTANDKNDIQSIEINFVGVNEPKKTINQLGSFYTHPAFTNDDKELSGVWFAKFELTGNINNPSILPNMKNILGQDLSKFHNAALAFTKNNNISKFTSRLIKNTDWNAAAYLSHSIYGINTEIRLNNSSSSTGCGALNENASSTTACEIGYGLATNYPQSTTGNISGIFDMSGGSWEYVMLNYNNVTRNLDGFLTFPNEKYLDILNPTSSTIDIDNRKYGIYETQNWYSDIGYMVTQTHPFLRRGGNYNSHGGAGSFATGNSYGNAAGDITARFILHE